MWQNEGGAWQAGHRWERSNGPCTIQLPSTTERLCSSLTTARKRFMVAWRTGSWCSVVDLSHMLALVEEGWNMLIINKLVTVHPILPLKSFPRPKVIQCHFWAVYLKTDITSISLTIFSVSSFNVIYNWLHTLSLFSLFLHSILIIKPLFFAASLMQTRAFVKSGIPVNYTVVPDPSADRHFLPHGQYFFILYRNVRK